jgi:hypothetical protein
MAILSLNLLSTALPATDSNVITKEFVKVVHEACVEMHGNILAATFEKSFGGSKSEELGWWKLTSARRQDALDWVYGTKLAEKEKLKANPAKS